MDLETDFRKLLELFNANGVEYLIVGAYALAHHGVPRYTGDLDLLVRPTAANATRVMQSLDQFGFGDVGLDAGDFTRPETVIQLGVPPVRIDLITSISGVPWEDAWSGRDPGAYADVEVNFLGRSQIVRNKRATRRARDVADLEALGEPDDPV